MRFLSLCCKRPLAFALCNVMRFLVKVFAIGFGDPIDSMTIRRLKMPRSRQFASYNQAWPGLAEIEACLSLLLDPLPRDIPFL